MSLEKDIIIKQFKLDPIRANIYEAGVKAAAKEVVTNTVNFYKDRVPANTVSTPELYKSKLGTPVFSDLNISAIEYVDPQNPDRVIKSQGIGDPSDSNLFRIDTVLFTVDMTKNIILTPIQGRPGTIKEFISDGDYHVNIRGVLTGVNGEYPKDAFRILMDILKAPIALDVNSWYLSQLGIFQIVVTDFQVNQPEAMLNTQPFEINCISETPVELIIAP